MAIDNLIDLVLAFWSATAKAKTHDLSTLEGFTESQAAAREANEFSVYQNTEARAVVEKFYNANVPVLDTGARGATVTFAQKQLGDVLLNWENELWPTLDEFGKGKFEIVYPPSSILGEPPMPSSTRRSITKAPVRSRKPI